MIYRTFKKLENELELKDNGTYVFGFLKNTYVLLSEGQGFKQVNFFFPVKITEEDTQRIKSWQKKGYAHNIEFSEEDVSSAKFTFREAFLPTKLQVLKEVIEDVVTYIYDKHPNETPVCSGVNCHNHNNLEIYDDNGLPTPLCPDCAKTIENSYELNEVEKQELPNNYLYGFLGACLFAIPGIIFAILLYLIGRVAAVTGLICYFLALKGYSWAKGKVNKVGVLIISLTSLLFTAIGAYLGFVFSGFKYFVSNPDIVGVSAWELLQISFSMTNNDPDLQKDMLSGLYISLFLCGICIVWYTYLSLKQTKKRTITKL